MQNKADKPLSVLTPSMQRLLLIARAVVKDPLILALDEPCQGMDDYQTRQIATLLNNIHEETGISILFISHYEEDVPQCVRNVLELRDSGAFTYQLQKTTRQILQAL
ncbi:MAG: hypothetical protein QM727_09460 [Niabella sp.]